MKCRIGSIVATLTLIALTSSAFAAPKATNPMNEPPGQAYKQKGHSVKGTTGASGYTPGYEMRHNMKKPKGNASMPGASGYAPGHAPNK